jgi:hypothetical protein
MINDWFHGSSEGMIMADEVIEKVCLNGGMHLYDGYLRTKDNSHCSQRLV